MLVKLTGFLDFIDDDSIHIDVSGVVYKVFLSAKDMNKLGNLKETIKVNIHEILREDARYLFGFLEVDEKRIFEDLIKVQGVGGKMALNIIGVLEVQEIIDTVRNNITANFTQISGIGNKVSQRLINEMKDKIGKDLYMKKSHSNESKFDNNKYNDLLSCLINLGYNSKISEEVSRKVLIQNSQKDLENLIPLALKVFKTY